MIVEHVILPVRAGREAEFEAAFANARQLIEASDGCRGLSLSRGVEHPETYLLLVEWDSVDAHEIGFRGSPAYGKWSALLHGFYDPFPTVTHFGPLAASGLRAGPRPETSTNGPHRQRTQRSTPAIWGRLVARTFALDGVVEGHSSVSPASSRAALLEGISTARAPETSLAHPGSPAEPVHLHGVDDTSIHLCLPSERAAELCDRGWGEPHQYADYGTEIMIYGPRDETELEFVIGVIGESVTWALQSNKDTLSDSTLT
ncbi:antibiotic biosynthesis monooxygenase family protein [Lacisediminihabitans sp. FW035]